MDAVLAMAASSTTSVNEVVASVRARSDAIHRASVTIAEGTTELMQELRNILQGDRHNVWVVGVMLQIQAKSLHDSCFPAFYFTCKEFLSRITSYQAQVLSREVADISYRVTSVACRLGLAKSVVGFLLQLAELCAFSDACLISIHVDLLQACVAAQMYGVANRFLAARRFFDVDLTKSTLNPQECMQFFYYKGICHVANKDFAAAYDAFLVVLSLPTPHTSAIAVKALRKVKLVALIHDHKPLAIPKYVSSAVSAIAGDPIPPYDDLAGAFKECNVSALVAAIEKHRDALDCDQNLGLAKQTVSALRDLLLQRLAKAYITVPVQQVCTELGLKDPSGAIQWIVDAVRRGQVAATVEGDMVRFGMTCSSVGPEMELLAREAFAQMHELSDNLRKRHAALLVSPTHVIKSAVGSKSLKPVRLPVSRGRLGEVGAGMPSFSGASTLMDTSP